MDCNQFKDILYRYLDHELEDDRLTSEAQQHLQACPVCALAYEKEKKLDHFIKGHLIKESAPYDLREAVIERIEQADGWRQQFGFSKSKLWPSLGSAAALIVIVAFTFVSTFSQPFPVFAESINRHVDYLKGGYPIEIQSNDINEVLAWFKGKVDFAIMKPHLDHSRVKLLGARICNIKDRKVAYFIYEWEGKKISAFVMNYDQLQLPRSKDQMHEHGDLVFYKEGDMGYESVLCFHKSIKMGCILVSDIPEKEFMKLILG